MPVTLKPLFFGVTFWGLVQCRQEPKSTTSSPLLPESAGYVKAGWGKSAGYLDKYWQPSVGCLWARSALKFGGFELASWCWNMLKQSQNGLMTELWEGYPWPLEVSDIQEALYSRAADKARSSTFRLWTFGGDQAFLFKYEPTGWSILYILCSFFRDVPNSSQFFIRIGPRRENHPLNGLFNGEDYDQPRNFRPWSTTIPGGWSRPGGVSAPLAGIAGRSLWIHLVHMQMRQTPLVGPKEKWGLNVGEAIMNHPDFDGLYWFILVYTGLYWFILHFTVNLEWILLLC